MGPALARFTYRVCGATLFGLLVALRETYLVRAAAKIASAPVLSFRESLFADWGAIVPLGVAVAIAASVLEPLVRSLALFRDWADEKRDALTVAAPAAVLAGFGWLLASAHVARAFFALGPPVPVGLSIGVSCIFVALLLGMSVLAVVPLGARWTSTNPRTAALASLAAALFVAGLFAGALFLGDGKGVLGILRVLRKPELDLRGPAHLTFLFLGAAVFGAGLGRLDLGPRAALAALFPALLGAIALATLSSRLSSSQDLASAVRRSAPLGGTAIALLQRVTDRDGDGYSSRFGGGDCDDRDPSINPAAVDVPGNGVDEDCTGADTPVVAAPPPRATVLANRGDRAFNVLLLTVDALRFDLGFMGNPKPVSPRLDELAARSAVFENAYAMASMTWQSLGALHIGKYPSELGGNDRFNHYRPDNVMLAERLKEAGVRTFAGMCHFSFTKPLPSAVSRTEYAHLGHGFDVWDTTAEPAGIQGWEDDNVTSDKLTDAAIALLSSRENVEGRFFGWFHYFDPHTAYVEHGGAPDFSSYDTSPYARDRAAYDSEVWFVDQQLGRLVDFVSTQPWGKDTAILVTGDHGEAFGEHGKRWHRDELWEELVHVPLLVYVPGQAPRRIAARRSHVDLARTILDLEGANAQADDSVRGTSLLVDVLAPGDSVPEERAVYAEVPPSEGPLRRALISGPRRGLKIVHKGGVSYDLFDLDKDPGERTDLASTWARVEPEVKRLQEFRAALKEIPFVRARKE